MQSSNLKAYQDARQVIYQDLRQRAWTPDRIDRVLDAYDAGYNHAHGIACHNVPTIGESIWTDSDGRVTVDSDNIADVHSSLCFEAEMNARCFSPWEFIAHDINTAGDEWLTESMWEHYDLGVADAISHDLEGYEYE